MHGGCFEFQHVFVLMQVVLDMELGRIPIMVRSKAKWQGCVGLHGSMCQCPPFRLNCSSLQENGKVLSNLCYVLFELRTYARAEQVLLAAQAVKTHLILILHHRRL